MKDLIDRQAAIDAVEFGITFAKVIDKSTGEVKELFREGNDSLTAAIKRIKNLPSAQPERMRGRWIYGEDNPGTGRDGWFCSECGHFEMWDYSADMKSAELNLPNYCPNCGADMREVDDERHD